jgi:hypothetical protein
MEMIRRKTEILEEDIPPCTNELCGIIWSFDQAVMNLHIARNWSFYFGAVDILTAEICEKLRNS